MSSVPSFPAQGVLVLDGADSTTSTCVHDPAVTTANGIAIAAHTLCMARGDVAELSMDSNTGAARQMGSSSLTNARVHESVVTVGTMAVACVWQESQ